MITQQDIISAALFIKNTSIIPTHWEAATGHFWSLSVEEQFYIIFPFILKKNTNGYVVALLLLIVAIPLLPVLEGHREGVFHTNAMHIFVDTMRYMTPILTGSLFAVLVFRKAISERLYPNNMITNLLILFLAYEIYCGAGPLAGLYYKSFLSAALTAIVIVNNITPSGDLFFRLLNSRALVLIGMASYSIYVWQQVFLMAHPWAQAGSEWLELAVVLVISFLSYYFIERKLAAIKSRFR